MSGCSSLPVQNIGQDIEVCLCWQDQVWWFSRQVERRHRGHRGGEVRETQDVAELVDQHLCELNLLVSVGQTGEDEGSSLIRQR